MKKVAITSPSWIGQDEAQAIVVRNLRAHALLKLEFYRSKMKPLPPSMDHPWDKAMPHAETWITEHFQELVEHMVATTVGSQN
jgi:hypothetical protein